MNEFELLRTLLVSAGHGVITLGPGDDLNVPVLIELRGCAFFAADATSVCVISSITGLNISQLLEHLTLIVCVLSRLSHRIFGVSVV